MARNIDEGPRPIIRTNTDITIGGIPVRDSGMAWFSDKHIAEAHGVDPRALPEMYVQDEPDTTLVTVRHKGDIKHIPFKIPGQRRLVTFFADYPMVDHGEAVLGRSAGLPPEVLPGLLAHTVMKLDTNGGGKIFDVKEHTRLGGDSYKTYALRARVRPDIYKG